ncbi:MAG TPA: DUF1844 domain-containing protein [Phycisphaerae bacterium]|jgi:hypothetical protein|nr:DUF1844 domain-containing protein [Phycisphaerae bacterium]HRR87332.1 DUF1844 domain-containing protein [Phycisphaerae bacterium]
MAEDNKEAPKIIIDDDWKEQARREKEEADREARAAEETERGPLPGPHIAEIIQMITMQATIGLGGFRDQNGKTIPPSLEYAKHYIDLLELLQNKTRNNLDDQEQRILTGTLQELRLAFVEVYEAMLRQAASPPPPKK